MSEKYEFIAAGYAQNHADNVPNAPSLEQMLPRLDVSKSGYYDWIEALFDYNDGTYGYRRIHAEADPWR